MRTSGRKTKGRGGRAGGGAWVSTRAGGAGSGGGEQGGRSQRPALISAAGSMISAAKSAATLARYAHSRASSRYSRTLLSTEMRNIAPRSSIWMEALGLPGPRNRAIRRSRGTSVTSSCQMASGCGQRLSPTTGSTNAGAVDPLLSVVGGSAPLCASSAARARPTNASRVVAITHERKYRHALTPRPYLNAASEIGRFGRAIAATGQILCEGITTGVPYIS